MEALGTSDDAADVNYPNEWESLHLREVESVHFLRRHSKILESIGG